MMPGTAQTLTVRIYTEPMNLKLLTSAQASRSKGVLIEMLFIPFERRLFQRMRGGLRVSLPTPKITERRIINGKVITKAKL